MADVNPAFKRPKGKQVTEFVSGWATVATALIKHAGIHEGLWRVHLKFDLRAATFQIDPVQSVPAAFVPALGVTLTRVDKPDAMTVDAAEVNPRSHVIVPGEWRN